VQCKVEGCTRTWTWTAAEQIEAFGQPPPKRMCAEHHTAMHTIEDREVRCSNPWCERTWTWTKAAQLGHGKGQANRPPGKSDATPQRTCDHCQREERELTDAEIPCRVDGCTHTWTWTRDAQVKHRTWLRHQPPGGAPEGSRGGKRRRGRGNRNNSGRGGIDGPAPRMCESCRQRLNALVDRETSCKVHGCTRTAIIDRESQLRAWALAGDQPLSELALPKRMCDVCREFCRLHHDREVACGRPPDAEGNRCDRTWTYKTGAQLQAFLAGRFEDPLRLCATCIASGHAHLADLDAEAEVGYETMPCIVPQCEGIWHYAPSMEIGPCNDGDRPLDRMCNACRTERGAEPRTPVRAEIDDDTTDTSTTDEPSDVPDDSNDTTPETPETSDPIEHDDGTVAAD